MMTSDLLISPLTSFGYQILCISSVSAVVFFFQINFGGNSNTCLVVKNFRSDVNKHRSTPAGCEETAGGFEPIGNGEIP